MLKTEGIPHVEPTGNASKGCRKEVSIQWEMVIHRFTQKKKRKTLINRERKRLLEIFENVESKHKQTVEKLIDEAAFMTATLTETREIIIRDGIVDEYKNGENQFGTKKSAAVEVYDKMLNTYTKVIKQLCDILGEIPKGSGESDPGEELVKFLTEHRA